MAVGYRSTVGFTSTDAQATLPPNYGFTPADEGQCVFAVTYRNSGIVVAGQPFDLYVFPYDKFWNPIFRLCRLP